MIDINSLGLPAKFSEWRPGQGEIVEDIASRIDKFYLLDAPPGAGKTIIGFGAYKVMFPSLVSKQVMARIKGGDEKERVQKDNCVYITPTKQLQEQITGDFPFCKTLVGRANYGCPRLNLHKKQGDSNFYTAEDCTATKDSPCDYRNVQQCMYFKDKEIAVTSEFAVLNTAYYLSEINGPGQFSGRSMLIVDELDSLESALMNFIKLEITSQLLEYLHIQAPSDTSNLQSWLNWASMLNLNPNIERGEAMLTGFDESHWTDLEITALRATKRLKVFQEKINQFNLDVNDTWIFEEKQKLSRGKPMTAWTFKPSMIASYAEQYIWKHTDLVLGMSGTILDSQITSEDLGLTGTVSYSRLPSSFPVENRPIYYRPAVNLTSKTMEKELPKLADTIMDIIKLYPDEKVLIHTCSYLINDYLSKLLPRDRVITHNSIDKIEQLDTFKESKKPLIMLSPAMDRGVDLEGDLCRCVIICKVPYINLGDAQTKARMKLPSGQKWYLLQAVRSMIQMSGRGVRSSTDRCDTYILDRQFSSLKARMREYFPDWWMEAIKVI